MEAIETAKVETGCLFHDRCPFATGKCRAEHPELLPVEGLNRQSRCFYPRVRRVVAVPVADPPQAVER
jgi:ABC-type dipeptide/oligopeptide/nickel transport system ATPase component